MWPRAVTMALMMIGLAMPAVAAQPCWFESPHTQDHAGVIGMASEFGGPNLIALSRERAVNGLLDINGVSIPADLDVSADTLSLNGLSIRIAPVWTHKGYHYSYAYLDSRATRRWVSNGCDPASCQPQKCQPGWLCEPAAGAETIVTTAQRATSQPAQYRALYGNALDQLQAMYGVAVDATRITRRTEINNSTLNLSQFSERQQQSMDYFGIDDDPMLALARYCDADGAFFAQMRVVGLPSRFSDGMVWRHDWPENPATLDDGGAIGHFSGFLGNNLTSAKIRVAIENGLVELARNIDVSIESDTLVIDAIHDDQGSYFHQLMTDRTQAVVEARVLDVRFAGDPRNPDVFVWLISQ